MTCLCCAVIKPIYGAASIGVVKVTSLEELKATYTKVNKEMAGARIVAGAITTGEEADASDEPSTVRAAPAGHPSEGAHPHLSVQSGLRLCFWFSIQEPLCRRCSSVTLGISCTDLQSLMGHDIHRRATPAPGSRRR